MRRKKNIIKYPTNLFKAHHKYIFDNVPAVIFVVDTNGVITYVNRYIEKISHYKGKDLIGTEVFNIIAPESMKSVRSAFQRLNRGRRITPFEVLFHDKRGGKLCIKASASPIKDNGNVVGILAFATDVTEQKNNVKHLSTMVKELRLLFDVGKELTSIMNIDLLFAKILACLNEAFGYERTGILIIDEKTNELVIRVNRKQLNAEAQKTRIKLERGITGYVAKTGKPYLTNDTSKDKHYFPLDKRTKAELAVPLEVSKKIIGVINVESYKKNAFTEDDLRILTLVANQAAVAIQNSRLYESLKDSYLDTIRALVSAMEAKDPYTRGHTDRVRKYALKTARVLKLNDDQINDLNYAGYLHDIGKIGIADYILTKIEPLTKEEYERVKKHPIIGHNILRDIKHLKQAKKIIRSEHERYDGHGYPDGLKKDEIPIGARIVAVADAYDAMTTDRPYHKAMSKKDAIMRLVQTAGTQFDPKVVKAFVKVIKDLDK